MPNTRKRYYSFFNNRIGRRMWDEIYNGQLGLCNHCKNRVRHRAELASTHKEQLSRKNMASIDHIIPITKGGTNDADNLQILCVPCNSRKGNRDNVRNKSVT